MLLKESIFNTKTLRQTFLYFCIGATASIVDSLLYILFTRKIGIYFLLANFMSVNIGITFSFLLNSFFNFRKTHRLLKRAFSFYGVCYFGMLLSMTILYTGTRLLGFPDIPVKIFSVLLTGGFQFLFNKFITFGKI